MQGSAPPQSESSSSSHLSATNGQVPVPDSTKEAPTFTRPPSAADGSAPEPDWTTTRTPTSVHPLSVAADGPVPVPEPITGASTSSPATNKPAPVPPRPDWGSANSPYPAVTPEMLRTQPRIYQRPSVKFVAKQAGSLALMIGVPVLEALGVYWAIEHFSKHDKQKDQYP